MQAYGRTFAKIYNKKWVSFAHHAAPPICEFYQSTLISKESKYVLDLCCGTGQLMNYFLEKGFQVVGFDLSEHMLRYARGNNKKYVESGDASFVSGDAVDFAFDQHFGLVVATYDALNHLDGFAALEGCFQSVFNALVVGGYFIFDLNTRAGLKRWDSIEIREEKEVVLINRGIFDEVGKKAWTKITGFVQTELGLYERFDELVFNTIYDLLTVKDLILETGFRRVYFSSLLDLHTPIEEPEREGRVQIIAYK